MALFELLTQNEWGKNEAEDNKYKVMISALKSPTQLSIIIENEQLAEFNKVVNLLDSLNLKYDIINNDRTCRCDKNHQAINLQDELVFKAFTMEINRLLIEKSLNKGLRTMTFFNSKPITGEEIQGIAKKEGYDIFFSEQYRLFPKRSSLDIARKTLLSYAISMQI
ncbi:hypothetical protein ACQUW5_13070 [Legionella sp. CNM-1927-20]|uniref:hypothetical protein n=1 Tax=Legionella sp. CNM-1927-20 TaxID=3422221 RepID=UPI00403AB9D6